MRRYVSMTPEIVARKREGEFTIASWIWTAAVACGVIVTAGVANATSGMLSTPAADAGAEWHGDVPLQVEHDAGTGHGIGDDTVHPSTRVQRVWIMPTSASAGAIPPSSIVIDAQNSSVEHPAFRSIQLIHDGAEASDPTVTVGNSLELCFAPDGLEFPLCDAGLGQSTLRRVVFPLRCGRLRYR